MPSKSRRRWSRSPLRSGGPRISQVTQPPCGHTPPCAARSRPSDLWVMGPPCCLHCLPSLVQAEQPARERGCLHQDGRFVPQVRRGHHR
eukprot:7378656-Prymnesium_polylepis.2